MTARIAGVGKARGRVGGAGCSGKHAVLRLFEWERGAGSRAPLSEGPALHTFVAAVHNPLIRSAVPQQGPWVVGGRGLQAAILCGHRVAVQRFVDAKRQKQLSNGVYPCTHTPDRMAGPKSGTVWQAHDRVHAVDPGVCHAQAARQNACRCARTRFRFRANAVRGFDGRPSDTPSRRALRAVESTPVGGVG